MRGIVFLFFFYKGGGGLLWEFYGVSVPLNSDMPGV